MQLNEAATSAIKGAGLTVGSVISSAVPDGLPPHGAFIAWAVTVIYGVLQLIRCLPWLTDQAVAFWQIIRHWNWSRWWKIAGREEDGSDQ